MGKPAKKQRNRQESGVRSQESEIQEVIEKIVASPVGDELLARIFAEISKRDREILWGYLVQTDATELGYKLGLEAQSVHNRLADIEHKLGFDSRPELFRAVFTALWKKSKKS